MLSIIIATYNAERYISRCLDSIAAQQDFDIEVLVIDGGSQDGTMEVVSKHPVVDCFVSEPDNGIYDAWNKGIKKSSGEWIIFLGADDFFEPGALESLARVCNSGNELDFISGRVGLIDSEQNLLRVVGNGWKWSDFRHGMNVAHPGAAHRRSLFAEVGLYDVQQFKIVGDYELLLRKGNELQAGFVDIMLARMTIGGVSYMSLKALRERYRAKRKHRSVRWLSNIASLLYGFIKLLIKLVLIKLRLVRV